MIAKIIVHGPDRASALALLAATLADIRVAGTVTNLEFLGALARHPGFAAGQVDTGLIARDLGPLTARPPMPPVVPALAALAALGLTAPRRGNDPWDRLTGWRGWSQTEDFVSLLQDGQRLDLRVLHLGAGRFRVSHGDQDCQLTLPPDEGEGDLQYEADGLRSRTGLAASPGRIAIFHDGIRHDFALIDPLAATSEVQGGGDSIVAPMPGLVSSVRAVKGATVVKGDPILVLEAMKMEHILTAPRDGVVAEILVAERDQVKDGTVLLRLEATDG